MSHVDVDSGVNAPTALHDPKPRGGIATDCGGLIDHAAAKRSDGTAGESTAVARACYKAIDGHSALPSTEGSRSCLAMSMVDI